ncbi:ComEA family DNA-binding protein [Nanchangia anserum]|uniref:ComEA family DNA-binding protein n=1 Tax=Nanchangia anserum TaxID=2692125 RepID=A0A8I0KVM9_9ACTO|nr:ComEA family DNA-binding protein [Nanchangia anserum]MBD3689109.1 ComEA family DNA-binding protein [Nanchangia anserum]QOX81344.1 ComEA family DNA-binding protein [Nanchangia anserum]
MSAHRSRAARLGRFIRQGWEDRRASTPGGDAESQRWRWTPAPWSVAVLLAALVVVAIAAGLAHSTTPVSSPRTAPTVARSPSPASVSTPAGTPGAATDVLVVHVVGHVRTPGLVKLPDGARVADAVASAGGPTESADLSQINLARPLTDGEQLRVAGIGEEPLAPDQPGAPAGAASAGEGGAVNLNTADLAALETLPGIGPALAQRIIDHREENGRFTSVDDLTQVSGIGTKTLDRLRDKVCV